jgi:hypothetical protein
VIRKRSVTGSRSLCDVAVGAGDLGAGSYLGRTSDGDAAVSSRFYKILQRTQCDNTVRWGSIRLVLATPLTVILVVLGRHVEALKFLDALFGDEPALSEAEFFYQRMLAHDAVELVEQATSFIAAHSLAYYCDKVARHALILAQRDAERGVLEGCRRKALHGTVEALFANIALTQTAHSIGLKHGARMPAARGQAACRRRCPHQGARSAPSHLATGRRDHFGRQTAGPS